MKKFLSLLMLLLLTMGAQASIIPDGQEFSAVGEQITTLEGLYEATGGLFILENYGNASDSKSAYYTQGETEIELSSTATAASVVKIDVTRSGEEGSYTYTATIQAYDGEYYQNPAYAGTSTYGDQTRITVGETAQSFDLTMANTTNNTFWFTATVGTTTLHLNVEGTNAKWFPYTDSSGRGNYSQQRIYKATTNAASNHIYSLTTYGEPSGVSYTLAGTAITSGGTAELLGLKAAEDLEVSGVPEGYTYTTTLTADTAFTVTFLRGIAVEDSLVGKVATFGEAVNTDAIEEGWYVLNNNQDGNWSYYAYYTDSKSPAVYGGTTGFFINSTSNFTSGDTVTEENKAYLFKVIPSADGLYYIQNANGNYFLQLHDNSKGNQATLQGAATGGYPYTISQQTTEAQYSVSCLPDNTPLMTNGGNNLNLVGWGTGASTANNASWKLYKVTLTGDSEPTPEPEPEPEPSTEGNTYTLQTYGAPADVTFTLGGQAISTTQSVTTTSTYTVSDLSVSDVEGYAATPTLTADTAFIVTFTRSTALSDSLVGRVATFSEAESTDSIEEGWYVLNNNQDGNWSYYAYYTDSKSPAVYGGTTGFFINPTSNFTTGTTVTEENKVYLFKVIPSADGQYFIQNANGNYFLQLHDNSQGNQTLQGATTDGYPYTISQQTTEAQYSISCMPDNTPLMTNGGQNMNLVGWGSGTSTANNASWKFYKVTLSDSSNVSADYTDLESAITSAEAYTSLIGSGLGQYADANDAFTTALAAAQAQVAKKDTETAGNYQTTIDSLTSALTTATGALTLNLPEKGRYLRITSKATSRNLAGGEAGATTANTVEGTGAETIWYYGENGLMNYNSGTYLDAMGKNASFTAKVPGIVADPYQTGYYGVYTTETSGSNPIVFIYNANTNGNLDRGSNSSADMSTNQYLTAEGYAWSLEYVDELPVTLSALGNEGKTYTTLYLPMAAQLPDDVKAYTVQAATGGSATENGEALIVEVEGNIPAETPVLLIGTGDADASINVTVSTESNLPPSAARAAETADNLLTGIDAASLVTATDYYLGQSGTTAGLFLATSTSSYLTSKAYLPVAKLTSASATGFAFTTTPTTGINTAVNLAADGKAYDLQGRRVVNAQKGLYIVNGKKVLVK